MNISVTADIHLPAQIECRVNGPFGQDGTFAVSLDYFALATLFGTKKQLAELGQFLVSEFSDKAAAPSDEKDAA